MRKVAIRTYEPESSLVFLKTKEAYGGLSNMAGGFPIEVNDIVFLTSEALYQSCRFPHHPDLQKMIVSQTSPMTAKMKVKPVLDCSREDWLKVRVRIMRWCITCKLVQNWTKFSDLLLSTGDLPIVEQSRKDRFWGATPMDGKLVGANVLGRLLMELREGIRGGSKLVEVHPPLPEIENFLLFGENIGCVSFRDNIEPYQFDSLI